MNKDKVNYFKYQSRLKQRESLKRLAKNNDTTIKDMDSSKELFFKLRFSDLADDSLKEIQEDSLKRLSNYILETSEISTEVKQISRVLKLRKKPKLKD